FIELLEFRLRDDPSRTTTTAESEYEIEFKGWKIWRIICGRQCNIPRLLLRWLIQMAGLYLLIVHRRVEHLALHCEADLLQHLADHSSLDFKIRRSDQGHCQPVRIPGLAQQGTGFSRIEGIWRQVGIISKGLDGSQRRNDHPIAFGSVADEVFTIDGKIRR